MIALWLLYAGALGVVLGFGAMALERVARLLHAPTRWVWVVVIVASVTVPVALALQPRVTTPAAVTAGAIESPRTPANGRTTISPSRPLIPTVGRPESLATPLLWAWGAGTVLLGGILLGGWLAQRRARRRWRAVAVGGRRVLVAPDAGPAVVGVSRLEIVLPEWALVGDETALRMMLRHEEQHIQARDPNLLLLAAAALVLFPWNVALWWLSRRLRLAIEVDCDRRVLRLGEDVHSYGSLLLDVASRTSGAALVPGSAFSESASQLGRRIEAMSAPEPSRPVLQACAFGALCTAAVVVACASPRPQPIRSATPAGPLFPPAPVSRRAPDVSMVTHEQMTAGIAEYFPGVLRGDTGVMPLQFVLDSGGRIVSTSRGYQADTLYPDEGLLGEHGENVLAGVYGPAPVRVTVRWLKPDALRPVAAHANRIFPPFAVPRRRDPSPYTREQLTAAIARYFPEVLRGDTGVLPLQFVLDIDGRVVSTSRGMSAESLYPAERVQSMHGESWPAGSLGPAPVRVRIYWLKPDSAPGIARRQGGATFSFIDSACTAPNGPPIERLQALARQYHPEALTRARSRDSVLVAFVLDRQCRALHHTTGRQPSRPQDIETTLASLFPGIRMQPFLVAGILFASADTTQGSPQIVWGVPKN